MQTYLIKRFQNESGFLNAFQACFTTSQNLLEGCQLLCIGAAQ